MLFALCFFRLCSFFFLDTYTSRDVVSSGEADSFSNFSSDISLHTEASTLTEAGPGVDSSYVADATNPCTVSVGLPTAFDIGDVLLGKVKLKDLSFFDKFCYLKHHVMPKEGTMVTQVICKGKDKKKKILSFQQSWLKKYKWLTYSHTAGGGLCTSCILFPPSSRVNTGGVFVSEPFVNLKKACGTKGKLEMHSKLQYHRDALVRAQALVSTIENPDRSIENLVSQEARQKYDSNLHILSSIVEAILFCARQNIALRGHRDDMSSSAHNKGKFIALLHLLSKFDDTLRHHLEFGKRNALYTSKNVQNELLAIMGDIVREDLCSPLLENNAVFSIIADEITESHSNREILSICLRFVTWSNELVPKPSIREVFFDFRFLTRITGQAISSSILECLSCHGLDVQKARGQAYDGSSNMSSQTVGVQALIRQSAPLALYTHCRSHVLNLSIASACKIPEVRNI